VTGIAIAEALATVAGIELDKERARAELVASRELLERTDKLRQMGEMAAGISHDLKNILNPLSLHVQLLRRMLKRSEPGAGEVLDEIAHVIKRGVETVERLREFSRSSPETPVESVALDAVAHEAIELCRPRIASRHRARGIRVVERMGAPPPVEARSSELVAALVNLIANAMDALEDGGSVTVTTGAADGGAWVDVADDGPGVPAELQSRIFEPFFTTKGKAGTGLGLAMVLASVRRYGGKLALESAPGRGTTFRVWLPFTRAVSVTPPPEPSVRPGRSGS
jgi:signal transduction histidine kinase